MINYVDNLRVNKLRNVQTPHLSRRDPTTDLQNNCDPKIPGRVFGGHLHDVFLRLQPGRELYQHRAAQVLGLKYAHVWEKHKLVCFAGASATGWRSGGGQNTFTIVANLPIFATCGGTWSKTAVLSGGIHDGPAHRRAAAAPPPSASASGSRPAG